MKNQLLLFLLIMCCTAHAQKPFNDSIALFKRNYINATLGEDEGKRTLLKQLAAIPQEQEVSDQNVIELQQLYPISSKEIKYLTNTLCADGSWKDINYKDSKRSGLGTQNTCRTNFEACQILLSKATTTETRSNIPTDQHNPPSDEFLVQA